MTDRANLKKLQRIEAFLIMKKAAADEELRRLSAERQKVEADLAALLSRLEMIDCDGVIQVEVALRRLAARQVTLCRLARSIDAAKSGSQKCHERLKICSEKRRRCANAVREAETLQAIFAWADRRYSAVSFE